MSEINLPIIAIARSTNKQSNDSNNNYNVSLNLDYSLNKFRYLKIKLIDVIYPMTAGTDLTVANTDTGYYWCDIRLNNVNFINSFDSDSAGKTIGFITNASYKFDGAMCKKRTIGYEQIIENPQQRLINIIFTYFDSSGSITTTNISNAANVLIFQLTPYFINDVV